LVTIRLFKNVLQSIRLMEETDRLGVEVCRVAAHYLCGFHSLKPLLG
jgi:hypothetical protein